MPKALILLIDQSPDTRAMYADCFRYHDYEVVEAADGREGLRAFHRFHPDLVVTELSEEPAWVRSLQALRNSGNGHTAMIACSTLIDRSWHCPPAGIEVDVVLPKPTLPNTLLAEAQQLLARRSTARSPLPA